MRLYLSGLFVLHLLSIASAEPAAAQAAHSRHAEAEGIGRPGSQKSPAKALALSIGHTVAATSVGVAALRWSEREADALGFPSFLLASYGVIMAPSAGSYYAEDRRRTLTGIQIRSAGGALLLASLMGQILPEETDAGEWDTSWKWDWAGIGGVALIGGGIGYSFAAAGRSAKEYNPEERERTRISASPDYDPLHRTLGVRVDLRF